MAVGKSHFVSASLFCGNGTGLDEQSCNGNLATLLSFEPGLPDKET